MASDYPRQSTRTALDIVEGTDVNELRVAQGFYQIPWSRTQTFRLVNGITVKGGYAGYGEPDPNARDIEKYKTILSGDVMGNDREISNPCQLLNDPCRADNCYHVITSIGNDATAVLDGFIVTGGNANSWGEHSRGGGMICGGSSPTISNCTFKDNYARQGGGMHNAFNFSLIPVMLVNCTFAGNIAQLGGGMDNWESSATLTNCTFTGNSASFGGGGMNNRTFPCFITLTNCMFFGNWSGENGGGMYNDWESILTLTNCTFTGNSAAHNGGAVYNYLSIAVLTNCSFRGNLSSKGGGGVYNYDSFPGLINCTFAVNSAPNGNALACDSLSPHKPSDIEMTNCILWDGGDEIWNNDGSTITITYSDVQGSWPGDGKIDADPCFAELGYWDPNGTPEDANDDFWVDGDYHLKSQAGRWEPDSESWVKDDVTSSCIDAGNLADPIGHEPFPNGGIINMGAYGGTAEASKSYFGEPVCETIIAGDINGDCEVNFKDFAFIALHWLEDR